MAIALAAALLIGGLAPEPEGPELPPSFDPGQGITLDRRGDRLKGTLGGGLSAVIHPDGSVSFNLSKKPEVSTNVRRRRAPLPPHLEELEQQHARMAARAAELPHQSFGSAPVLLGIGVGLPGLGRGVGSGRRDGAKAAFLRATASMRLRMALEWNANLLAKRLKHVGQELALLWNDRARSPEARRRAIFELWIGFGDVGDLGSEGELGLESTESLDALRARYGRRLQERVEEFVRKILPRGSPDGYSDAEIARLNGTRRGAPQFAPYR